MTIDSLECKDIKIVPINSAIWDQLEEKDKIPFVDQLIRTRVADFKSSHVLRLENN